VKGLPPISHDGTLAYCLKDCCRIGRSEKAIRRCLDR
jgi:hypothetical protein